jgi:two-component system, OmpR family, sensor kinase
MSIRLRLALWYGALAGVAVLLVSLFTYSIHTRGLYDDVDRTMVSAAQHVVDEYSAARESGHIDAALAAPFAPELVVRAYTSDGQLIATSPTDAPAPVVEPRQVLLNPSGPPYDVIAALSPSFVEMPTNRGWFSLIAAPGGERWRLYLLSIDEHNETVLVEAPLHRIDASVARFRRLLALISATGILVTLGLSALIAGRALRPVATLTTTAGDIARSREFGQRVGVSDHRDELGRLAVTFNEMLQSLEDAYRSQQRFVADASHELRAPLTIIQANLELIERRQDLPDLDRQEAIQEVAREARRLTRLVSDLLALARADAGVPIRRVQVELDRLVLDAFTEARHLAQGQRFEIDALETAMVNGDPDRLKQLLLILLDNATKYTPEGGLISVALRRSGPTVTIVVRDTGVGMSAEALPQVFDRFFRADPARSRDPGGTGLGLPIARWIARQHGGDIALASEVGKGTIATVHLPLVITP